MTLDFQQELLDKCTDSDFLMLLKLFNYYTLEVAEATVRACHVAEYWMEKAELNVAIVKNRAEMKKIMEREILLIVKDIS